MGQAWIITHKPKEFVDGSKTKNSHHGRVLLLGELYKGDSYSQKVQKKSLGERKNIYDFPLFSQMQGTEVLVLLN